MAFDATNFKVEVDDTLTEVLRHARKLIEKGWCQKNVAINKDGFACDCVEDDAVSFCSIGAVVRASADLGFVSKEERGTDPFMANEKYRFCFDKLSMVIAVNNNLITSSAVMIYNDSHTKEEVLAMFDKAIGE